MVGKSLIMALHTRTTPKLRFRSTTTNPETASLNNSSCKEVSRSSIGHRTTIDNHITSRSLRTSSSTTQMRSRSIQPNTSHLNRSTLLPSSNTMRLSSTPNRARTSNQQRRQRMSKASRSTRSMLKRRAFSLLKERWLQPTRNLGTLLLAAPPTTTTIPTSDLQQQLHLLAVSISDF